MQRPIIYLPSTAVALKAVEFILAIILLLFTQFGGGTRLGADPIATDHSKVGAINIGTTLAQKELGIFVITGYAYILCVMLLTFLLGERPYVTNFIFNGMGFIFYITIGIIQLITWSDPAQKNRYRDEVGVSPVWSHPPFPIWQGVIALILGLFLAADAAHSLVVIIRRCLENKPNTSDAPSKSEGDKTHLQHQLDISDGTVNLSTSKIKSRNNSRRSEQFV
jgi:hypothetical protein